MFPAVLAGGFSAVAVGTPDNTFGDFFLHGLEARVFEDRNRIALYTAYVIEVKDHDVRFATIDTGMLSEIVANVFGCGYPRLFFVFCYVRAAAGVFAIVFFFVRSATRPAARTVSANYSCISGEVGKFFTLAAGYAFFDTHTLVRERIRQSFAAGYL